MSKLYRVCMHRNTIQELKEMGNSEKLMKDFDFTSIKEAFEFKYPFHRDNYIIVENETSAEAYLWELNGDEKNLNNF